MCVTHDFISARPYVYARLQMVSACMHGLYVLVAVNMWQCSCMHHTSQVLGITNYSHWKLAGPVRQCLHGEPPPIQQLLLSLALKELRRFLHVGVMEMLDESIEALAVCLQTPAGPAGTRSLAGECYVCMIGVYVCIAFHMPGQPAR